MPHSTENIDRENTLSRKQFRTFLVSAPFQAEGIEGVSPGGEWSLAIADDPTQRFWWDSTGQGSLILERSPHSEELERLRGDYLPGKEVLIEAYDEAIGTNAASLIQTGLLLAYPDVTRGPKFYGVVPVTHEEQHYVRSIPFLSWFTAQENVNFAIAVAQNSWQDVSLRYAIEKYRMSLELDSFTPHSASPAFGQVFRNVHPEYSYHVKAATALVVAFSVIEELGLEVRASAKRPRFLDNLKGVWNPEVRDNVNARLEDAGVNLSEGVDWIYRGDITAIESKVTPRVGVLAPYSDGLNVRDLRMDVIDAIQIASYLRNFIVAHKYDDVVSSISPYDIHNVQFLARRLILSRLGLYKVKGTLT